MEDSNFNFKEASKVFREILGVNSSSENVAHTDEYGKEFSSNAILSEVKNPTECDSSLSVSVKNSNKDTSKTKTRNIKWGKVSRSYSGNTVFSKEPFVRKECPLEQLSSRTVQDQIKAPETKQASYKFANQMSNSNVNKSDEVPKFDSAFKRILGSNTSKGVQEKDHVESVIKKSDALRKQHAPVKSKIFYKKKSETYRNFKVDEEEMKVREIFARSRSFKLVCPVSNLNDLAGCGVDIFKCGQIMHSSFKEKVPEESELQDDSFTDYSKLSVPVTGLIANIKPLTRSDILNAPCVPLTEIWDDDFLF